MRHNIRQNNKAMFLCEDKEWDIDCYALRLVDWENIARIIVGRGFTFGGVVGVPNGGLLLQRFLTKYKQPKKYPHKILIVDDICTTGFRLERAAEPYRNSFEIEGVVLFNRGTCPTWVTPIFNLTEKFR